MDKGKYEIKKTLRKCTKDKDTFTFGEKGEINMSFDEVMIVVLVLLVLVIVFPIIFYLVKNIYNFKDELDYINMEIRRTVGGERRYWQNEKKKLWLSLIPFYRK